MYEEHYKVKFQPETNIQQLVIAILITVSWNICFGETQIKQGGREERNKGGKKRQMEGKREKEREGGREERREGGRERRPDQKAKRMPLISDEF